MNLAETLSIKRVLLHPEEQPGMDFAERLFVEAGSPTSKPLLRRLLQTIVRRAKAEGIQYPRVLRLRLGQLDRDTFVFEKASSEKPALPEKPAPRDEADILAEAIKALPPNQLARFLQLREQARSLQPVEPNGSPQKVFDISHTRGKRRQKAAG